MPAPASTTDQLVLGSFIFQPGDFSPPDRMPFGGAQHMAVHKLPGGNRVIDTLGPDEDDISWSGFFFASNALQQCQQLDAMRAAGTVVTLTFAGMSRQVVIKHFKPHIKRYPHWVEYEISCVVSTNPFATATSSGSTTAAFTGSPFSAAGIPGLPGSPSGAAVTPDALISSDLSTAATAAVAGSVGGPSAATSAAATGAAATP